MSENGMIILVIVGLAAAFLLGTTHGLGVKDEEYSSLLPHISHKCRAELQEAVTIVNDIAEQNELDR